MHFYENYPKNEIGGYVIFNKLFEFSTNYIQPVDGHNAAINHLYCNM